MAQGWGFVEAVVERCSGLGFRGLGVDGEGRCAENLSLRQSESCLPQFFRDMGYMRNRCNEFTPHETELHVLKGDAYLEVGVQST